MSLWSGCGNPDPRCPRVASRRTTAPSCPAPAPWRAGGRRWRRRQGAPWGEAAGWGLRLCHPAGDKGGDRAPSCTSGSPDAAATGVPSPSLCWGGQRPLCPQEKCPCPRARPAARGARGQALHGLLLLLAGICQVLGGSGGLWAAAGAGGSGQICCKGVLTKKMVFGSGKSAALGSTCL